MAKKRGRPKKKVEKEPEVKETKQDVEEKPEVKDKILIENEHEIIVEKKAEPEDEHPKEKLFRYDEAARMLGVNDGCIKLWVEHGHLDSVKIGGVRMITNSSILTCPFKRYHD